MYLQKNKKWENRSCPCINNVGKIIGLVYVHWQFNFWGSENSLIISSNILIKIPCTSTCHFQKPGYYDFYFNYYLCIHLADLNFCWDAQKWIKNVAGILIVCMCMWCILHLPGVRYFYFKFYCFLMVMVYLTTNCIVFYLRISN